VPLRDRSHYLNIVGRRAAKLWFVVGSAQPALPYVLGNTLRLAPDGRSYRLTGYEIGACRSLLRSPDGRYVMYGTSRGGWPALEVLDLATGEHTSFATHACDPAWSRDGEIAYVHYVSFNSSLGEFTARVAVADGLSGAPSTWSGEGAWAGPVWAGHDLLVNDGGVQAAHPGPLVILYGPGRQRIVGSRPREWQGPFSTVVAVNPAGTEALLDTERLGPSGSSDRSEDLATLLRVRDDRLLSAVRMEQSAYGAALAAEGDWSGSTIIAAEGVFRGGSSHPGAALVTLTVRDNRLALRSVKWFLDGGYEVMAQDIPETYQPTFLDASGRHVAVWYDAAGQLQYLMCDTLTERCSASRNLTYPSGPVTSAAFVANPSRP
jgi:hypothetical protein